MLDITFKQADNELYELRAQFGKDVDPDALLASISSLIEMVKKTFPATQQSVVPNKPGRRERKVAQTGDAESIIASMPEANKAILVSLFDYAQEHGAPVAEVRDITQNARKFKAYTDLMKGKNPKQEIQALRYQIKLLRDKELIPSSTDRTLAPFGIEIAQRLKPQLEVHKSFKTEKDNSAESSAPSGDDTAQDSSQELVKQSSDERLGFDNP